MMNELKKKINLNLCKCTSLNINFFNTKVYVDIKLCIYEHFDLIFINVKQEKLLYIMVSVKCNYIMMDLTHSK
jgi:hypothetical protein